MPAQTETESPPPKRSRSSISVGITIIYPTVYSNLAITSVNGKPRLVRVKDPIPLLSRPVLVYTCDLRGDVAPKHNQHMDDVQLALPRANDCAEFGQTYSCYVYHSVSSNSCGSLEAIAQVGVPNIAVLTTRRTSTT